MAKLLIARGSEGRAMVEDKENMTISQMSLEHNDATNTSLGGPPLCSLMDVNLKGDASQSKNLLPIAMQVINDVKFGSEEEKTGEIAGEAGKNLKKDSGEADKNDERNALGGEDERDNDDDCWKGEEKERGEEERDEANEQGRVMIDRIGDNSEETRTLEKQGKDEEEKIIVSTSQIILKCNDAVNSSAVCNLMELNIAVTGEASQRREDETVKFGSEEEKTEDAFEDGKRVERSNMEVDQNNEPSDLAERGEKEDDDQCKGEGLEEKEVEGDKANEKVRISYQIGENLEEMRSSEKQGTDKFVQSGSHTAAATLELKSKSSSLKKILKIGVESKGMIFMCSKKTKEDCFHYKVFGLPANKRAVVHKVSKGMRLFLFDIDLRVMYGIYKAAGPGGYDIEPNAFSSAFPSQVRFTVLRDCTPLPEEKFRMAIKDNYYSKNKFNCQLSSEQVKKLSKLFVAASRATNLIMKNGDEADNSRNKGVLSIPMAVSVEASGDATKQSNLIEEAADNKNSMVMNEGKLVTEEKSEVTATEEEETNEPMSLEEDDGDDEESVSEEEEEKEGKEEEAREEETKTGANSIQKGRKSKRKRKKAAVQPDPHAMPVKLRDGTGSWGPTVGSKREKSTRGMIFMCNSKTKQDCLRYKVLGLPANKREIVQRVSRGMKLFMFDVDLRMMYGIYKAAGPGGYNIEPKAFNSAFPSQVRFTISEDCLPLAEEKFKAAIKDNYYTKWKFKCELTLKQVQKLCKLFSSANRGRDRIGQWSAGCRYNDGPVTCEGELYQQRVVPPAFRAPPELAPVCISCAYDCGLGVEPHGPWPSDVDRRRQRRDRSRYGRVRPSRRH